MERFVYKFNALTLVEKTMKEKVVSFYMLPHRHRGESTIFLTKRLKFKEQKFVRKRVNKI